METALIVSASERGKQELAALLQPFPFSHILYASNGTEARKILLHSDSPALLIINAPLPDEPGRTLARFAAQNSTAEVLLLVKNECYGIALSETETEGVHLLCKPFARNDFLHAVRQSVASQKRLAEIRKENACLRRQLAEIRTIGRAKCMLIQFCGMTEEEAHHYIEKQAMNLRQNKYAIAKNILSHYQQETLAAVGSGNLVDFSY